MMNRPLKILDIITFASENYPNIEVVSVRSEGDIHKTNYLKIYKRISQLAHGLKTLGINKEKKSLKEFSKENKTIDQTFKNIKEKFKKKNGN